MISIISFSQIKEGQTFCAETKDGSYFPLKISKKLIYWYDTHYTETKEGTKEINGKIYNEFNQTWKNNTLSTLYLREENGVVYQYEDCCKKETIRFDKNFKKGHAWKTADGLTEYKLISYKGKLTTAFCTYDNLLVIEAKFTNATYKFYYFKGHGYIGATKDDELISIETPRLDIEKASNTDTEITTDYGKIKIPGKWEVFNYVTDSKQYYLKNSENIIIAITINPKKNYSFYSSSKTDLETVSDYYKWEYDYRVENGFKTSKLKKDKKKNFIIWKFTEKGIDNVFLYGVKSEYLVNYLVYTDQWKEGKKVTFLEQLYELNN